MLLTQTDMSTPAAPKVKKVAKPRTPPVHPPYASMITAAIKKLGDKPFTSQYPPLRITEELPLKRCDV